MTQQTNTVKQTCLLFVKSHHSKSRPCKKPTPNPIAASLVAGGTTSRQVDESGSEDRVPGLNLGEQFIHRRRRNFLEGRWRPRGLVVLVDQASANTFVEIADRHHVL